jgi:hypothetical protein
MCAYSAYVCTFAAVFTLRTDTERAYAYGLFTIALSLQYSRTVVLPPPTTPLQFTELRLCSDPFFSPHSYS